MISDVAFSALESMNGLSSHLFRLVWLPHPLVISFDATAMPVCAAFWATSIYSSFDADFFWTRNRRSRQEHTPEQPWCRWSQERQTTFQKRNAESRRTHLICSTGTGLRRSASTINTPMELIFAFAAPQQLGLNVILRLQHRADGWNFRGSSVTK
ncbi:hypothetical protein LJR220_001429 [Bradyrhizobium sp. LjRoot220]|uniref:hypothetical protein n=1 Tax=Bradyrhizobium sp. LjRoot220 TaxID=3342284 RepID=UPI003ED0A0E2